MDISESLQKVYSSTELMGERFYQQFFADCPEAQEYFADVDMQRQAVVVTMALTLVEQYLVSPYPPTAAYFEHLGVQHQERGIPPEMYPQWIESMLTVLEGMHGKQWDEALAGQWREGFEIATKKMLQSYQHK